MQHIVEDVDFLFIYEVRPREIDSICLLGAWLETQGYKVGYINTWDTMYHWHPEYRAKVAVLSACYNTPAYDYFTGHALSFEKVVNLQWEQVLMNSVAYSKVQTIWDFDGKAKEIRHVSWGENNRQYLQKKYGLGDDKMRVCGYLPLDFYRPELRGATMAKEQLFAKYGLDPGEKDAAVHFLLRGRGQAEVRDRPAERRRPGAGRQAGRSVDEPENDCGLVPETGEGRPGDPDHLPAASG